MPGSIFRIQMLFTKPDSTNLGNKDRFIEGLGTKDFAQNNLSGYTVKDRFTDYNLLNVQDLATKSNIWCIFQGFLHCSSKSFIQQVYPQW